MRVFYWTRKIFHPCVGTDAPCPAGWVDQELDFMSLCYYVSNSTKEGGATRMEALFRCRRLANRQEAHLVAINSQAEMVGLHQSARCFVLSLFSWWFFLFVFSSFFSITSCPHSPPSVFFFICFLILMASPTHYKFKTRSFLGLLVSQDFVTSLIKGRPWDGYWTDLTDSRIEGLWQFSNPSDVSPPMWVPPMSANVGSQSGQSKIYNSSNKKYLVSREYSVPVYGLSKVKNVLHKVNIC